MLAASPDLLHRFYADASTMTFADSDADAAGFTASGQASINARVKSLGLDAATTDIWSVDDSKL